VNKLDHKISLPASLQFAYATLEVHYSNISLRLAHGFMPLHNIKCDIITTL